MVELTPTGRPKSRPFEVAALVALAIGALYVGQGIFIPLVLAILVAFALNPIVDRLRRLGIHRLVAVVFTVVLVSGIALLASYVMAGQLLKLAADLPQYQQTVATKLRALQGGGADSPLGKLAKVLEDLGAQVDPSSSATQPAPIPVTIADRPASPLTGLTGVFGSILGPLATGTLVFIFSVFLLLERVELRDRFLKLVSLGDLRTSTKVMDESAGRVSRYLLVQLGVNCGFGVVFGAGMFVLGVPNAVLWGLLAIVFRYIPFIGTFAAVIFPAALAFAVDPGWTMLIGVVGIYLALELVTTNAIEPHLYGTSTGLSAMAVLIAAIFWATLWGLVGLVLATPLTVCLVVLGRYVPQLRFLDVLLGSEPVLLPEERFYKRLLAGNVAEAVELSESESKDGNSAEFFDTIALPALRLAAADLERDSTDLGRRRNVVEALSGVVEEFDTNSRVETAPLRGPITIIAGKTELDGAAANMLAQSMRSSGIDTHLSPPISLNKDGFAQLDLSSARVVVLCYLDPHPEPYVRYASTRIRRKRPEAAILACLFGAPTDTEATDLSILRVDATARSLREAVEHVEAMLSMTAEGHPAGNSAETRRNDKTETLRRFASQQDWLMASASQIAERFHVPLATAKLTLPDVATSQTGLAERVVMASEPIVIADATLAKDATDDAFLVENGFRSFIGVPLKTSAGETIGSLALYDGVPRDFEDELGPLILEAAALVTRLEEHSEEPV